MLEKLVRLMELVHAQLAALHQRRSSGQVGTTCRGWILQMPDCAFHLRAIIAIEREVKLGGLVERGQTLNAELSASLIESIFWPNSPLHDLGVVIRGSQIIAAGVQFPLAEEGVLPSGYGSRHRAAVGLSMDSDAVIVIVSEENGAVSLAERGQLTYDIPRDEFEAVLRTRLVTPSTEEASTTGTDSEDDSLEQGVDDATPSTDQQNIPEQDHEDPSP